ncbi:MAG: hypothetical protein EXR75_11855 [Myxococcales bacterium]|nr:hypothetical protein [Myxococcales bacterium]
MNMLRHPLTLGFVCLMLTGSLAWTSACAPPTECAKERAGQVRCVGNQVERCESDQQLSYEPCAPKDLVCSVAHGACVTPEVAMSTSASTSGTGGAGGESATTTVSSSVVSSSSSAGGSGGEGGTPVVTSLNGCEAATAQVSKGQPTIAITFSAAVAPYSPSCIVVSPGTNVIWISADGTFAQHPLRGGTVDGGGNKLPDPNSPIPATDQGNTQLVALTNPGAFGFYCDFHPSAMKGAIFVEP